MDFPANYSRVSNAFTWTSVSFLVELRINGIDVLGFDSLSNDCLGFPYKTSAMFPICHRLWHQTRLKTVRTWILAGILCSSTSFLDNLNSFPLNCNWTRTNIPKHTNAQNRLSVPWQNRKDLSAFAMAIKLSQRVNHVVVRYLHLSCIRTMAMILQPAKHPPNLKSAATARGLKKNSPRSLSTTSPKNHAWILFKNPHSHPGPATGRLSFQLLCLKKR